MNSGSNDKFSAVWVSHSSIADFLHCPRLYYLRSIYKDPISGHKITRIEPPLALGQVVHDVIDSLSVLPVEDRLKISLIKKLELKWEKISGKKGGFKSKAEEAEYKERGKKMLNQIRDDPGPILKKAIKIKSPDSLPPRYLISEDDNIILCGKVDWLEFIPERDTVHIIDFKTGKWDQDKESLQLPIYFLLAKNLQSRGVEKASYWYLDRASAPQEVELPAAKEAAEKVLKIARRIKLARQLEHFNCPQGGCKYCLPYESIVTGKGEKIGESDYQDIYIL